MSPPADPNRHSKHLPQKPPPVFTRSDFDEMTVGVLHGHILRNEQTNLNEVPLTKLIWVCHYDYAHAKGLLPSPHLRPYLEALLELPSDADFSTKYYMDDAGSLIGYFLNNATGWRGDVARAVKKELVNRHRAWLDGTNNPRN